MKKFLERIVTTALLASGMLCFLNTQGQGINSLRGVENCQLTIENDMQISPTQLQFDLYLKDTDPSEPFLLDIVQTSIFVSTSVIGGGTLTCSVVPGFSELVSSQHPRFTEFQEYDETRMILKMAGRIPPGCDSATIISTTGIGTRVVRLEIKNSVPFEVQSKANLSFCFALPPFYATKIFEYTTNTHPCGLLQVPTDTNNCFPGSTYRNVSLNAPAGIGERSNNLYRIYSNGKNVFVSCPHGFHNTNVTITNLLGQRILTQKLKDEPLNKIPVETGAGYYFVRVQSDEALKTEKVFIQ